MPRYTFNKPYYNVAKSANMLTLEEAWNVYFEEIPSGGFAIRRRPGLTASDAPQQVGKVGRGIYWSDRNQRLYIMTSKGVYMKPAVNSSQIYLGDITDQNRPAIFAEGQKINMDSIIYIANNGALNYIDVVAGNILTQSADPAITCPFITMMNNRFYASDSQADSNQDFYITDVNPGTGDMDPLYWLASTNPWRAAQNPDFISGVFSGWNEVYIWGTQACEVWQEDGVNPISPLVGSLMEIGLEAPYSVQMADNTLMALVTLAGKRAVVKIQGRGPKVISEPIANILQSYLNVSDAIGSLWFAGGVNLYILSFPTQGVTWCYDFKSDVWSQWSTWDSYLGQHNIFKAQFTTFATHWNTHYALCNDGQLCTVSRDTFTDDYNSPIRASVRTGWIDHGIWQRKRSDQLIIKLQGYASRDASIMMRHRSDGFQEWSNPIMLELRAGEQNDHFCKLNRMGQYRSRQYEFIMTDSADLALVGMEEDLTRMAS